jgi:two-component system sensor histidine kinase PilS (NtrC family)
VVPAPPPPSTPTPIEDRSTQPLRTLERSPGESVIGMGTATASAEGSLAEEVETGRRVLYLMLVRTVLISLVLGSQLLLYWLGNVDLATPASLMLFAIIGSTYLLTLVYALGVWRGGAPGRLANYQIAGDLVLTTLLVHVTGGAQSAFTFFYPLSIIGASAVRFRAGAITVALAAAALYVGVAVLGWAQVLPVPAGQRLLPWDLTSIELVRWLAVNLAAFAGVAVLAFNLGNQIQRTTQSLATHKEAAADLYTVHEDIVRSLASGLVTVDRGNRILTINQMAAEILDVRGGGITGRPVDEVIPGFSARFAEVAPRSSLRRADLTVVRPGRPPLHLGITLTPLRDNQDHLIGRIVNFQDLTEMRQLEQQMKRAERMAAIGALASGIAHEIRNPLASMSGSIELLREQPRVADDDKALMNIVVREIDRLNALISDLLDYANPHPRQRVEFDVALLARETVQVFQQDRTFGEVEVILESGDGTEALPMVGDPGRVRQVLWNLLRNAADAASRGGGKVWVRLRRGDPMEVEVADDGPGIASEHLPRIFDPFFTTKSRGTGLGLATCHSIVAEHGGSIDVASELGHGTSFVVHLPAAASDEQV